MKWHYTDSYLLNPTHQVTVNLIGCGGTGTQVLTGLARLSHALEALGHPGLMVRVFDPDVVTDANVGRQLFSPADVGGCKATISVSRINRYFGYEWQAFQKEFVQCGISEGGLANITISCIDTAKGRVKLAKALTKPNRSLEPYMWQMYWMDFGNLQKTGQVVLGTIGDIKQPMSGAKSLPNVLKLLPQIKKIKERDQGPSCSLAQALNKQDLFINSTLANFGLNLLWKLFREGRIKHQGCYLNLDSLSVNPIKIQPKEESAKPSKTKKAAKAK
jgi:PRTRC genetic system ThiF family protein